MNFNRKRRLLLGSFAALALAGQSLGAQQLAVGRTTQNLRFVAGGIGLDESEQMKALANEFSLTVVVVATSGAYLADTQVSIRNAEGQSVLDTHLASPYLLVELAAGRYDVEAVHNGIRSSVGSWWAAIHGLASCSPFMFRSIERRISPRAEAGLRRRPPKPEAATCSG